VVLIELPVADFAAWSTVGLSIATFVLALTASWSVFEVRKQRTLAEDTFAAIRDAIVKQRGSELVHVAEELGPERLLSVPGREPIPRQSGRTLVSAADEWSFISFDVRNVGNGAAEIETVRVLPSSPSTNGDDAASWEPVWRPTEGAMVISPDARAAIDIVSSDPPAWFRARVEGFDPFWIQLCYCDLASGICGSRWFEIRRRRVSGPDWYVAKTVGRPSGSQLRETSGTTEPRQ